MFSFEGEYRRKPVQSLGGASKHSQRDIFLQRTQLERQKREDLRRQNQSAVIIQAFFRGCRARSLQKHIQRQEFETVQAAHLQNVDMQLLTSLMKHLNFFFDKEKDANKLIWLSQMVIKNSSNIMKQCQAERPFTFTLAQFLSLTICYICNTINSSTGESKGSHWRVLEIFLNTEGWSKIVGIQSADIILGSIFFSLSQKGYFTRLRQIIDAKVPPLVEPTTRAPNPLSGCLLDFLIQPLEFACGTLDISHRNTIVKSFRQEFLEPAYSEPIINFILPCLTLNNHKIPLLCMLENNEICGKNPWLFHSMLVLAERHPELKHDRVLSVYVATISRLSGCLQFMHTAEIEEDNDDSDEEDMKTNLFKASEHDIMNRCCEILNNINTVNVLVSALRIPDVLSDLCVIAHNLLLSDRLALHKCRLLYTLAFKPCYLQQLLVYIKSEKQISLFGSSDTSLILLLAKGVHLTPSESQRIVPVLDVFCSLFSHLLVTLDDSEFYNESESVNGAMPFKLYEVVELASTLRDVCLGLVELAYPDTRPSTSFNFIKTRTSTGNSEEDTRIWMHLFKSTVNLVSQLHTRDTRRPFCQSGLWVTGRIALPLERNGQVSLRRQGRLQRPFRAIRPLTRNEIEEEGNSMLSTREVRTLAILREIPFVFSFTDRVKMWQQWILNDKKQQQGEANFLRGPSIQVMIRRNYIYEDAFDKLSLENEPNLRWKMRVQLTNAVGLDEAGVDGGGIFREFLSELLKTSFDPNRGFFRLTHDNLLYPNPGVAVLVSDFPAHYYFIGRMLGKALYENLLVELPMADFFLSKILGQASASLDVHHLASLDPVLHKNLLYLRHYDGDVTELGLDFTIVSSELGETRVEELKPNGSNIPVTSSNRIEYIHLVADYKLNKQIRLQCNAFRQGLANVIDIEWLQTFSYRELQVLVSGAYTPVDLEDLKQHTHYAGGYTSTHPVIQGFWRVVSQFDDSGKRHLLKFVTSCSRPPLLGFKELDPPFCIQNAGTDDRLPTASTCMNLLKLPEFHDENILRDKLVYALQSGAGFELS
ncbi:ubiquitin-protein ligase E3C-like [Daphnia carinata]|uniref:ubiquitin-protein ligase E3C-like n=1 Tax=Daphnia carinata TaxID=120202 RepID=UPI00257B7736|nr:ubiquitin-protein ligase E3C-like [Daphnia carinata]